MLPVPRCPRRCRWAASQNRKTSLGCSLPLQGFFLTSGKESPVRGRGIQALISTSNRCTKPSSHRFSNDRLRNRVGSHRSTVPLSGEKRVRDSQSWVCLPVKWTSQKASFAIPAVYRDMSRKEYHFIASAIQYANPVGGRPNRERSHVFDRIVHSSCAKERALPCLVAGGIDRLRFPLARVMSHDEKTRIWLQEIGCTMAHGVTKETTLPVVGEQEAKILRKRRNARDPEKRHR